MKNISKIALLLASISFAEIPKIAILPLLNRGIDSSEANVVSDGLSNAFVHINDIRVLERQQMNEILKEQGFEKSGVCDSSECAVKTGKILGIDQIITGSFGKINDSYVMNLRRINVSTGEILGSLSKSGDIDHFLHDYLQNIALELMGKPPIKIKENTPTMNPYTARTRYSKRQIDSMQTALLRMVDSSRASSLSKSKIMADSLSKLWAPAAANASIATNGDAAKIGMKALEDAIKSTQEMAKNGYSKMPSSDSIAIEKHK